MKELLRSPSDRSGSLPGSCRLPASKGSEGGLNQKTPGLPSDQEILTGFSVLA